MSTSLRGNAKTLPLIVTAAVIRDGDKVLLAQRKNGSHLAGKWEFPGGKLEPGESPEACLARELREELGIRIEVQDIFKVVYHQYPQGPVLLLAYCASIEAGRPRPLDCQEVRWVAIGEVGGYELAPADVAVVTRLVEGRGGRSKTRITRSPLEPGGTV